MIIYMHMQEKKYRQFVREFETKVYPNKKELLFLGIGSNQIIGDCFGPLVGTYLQLLTKKHSNIHVKGTMKYPITKRDIYKLKNENNLEIVAIDSAMIDGKNTGDIYVTKSPIVLGEAVGMFPLKIGNYTIKASLAINTKCKRKNIEQLKKVPKHKVTELAYIVANGIYEVIDKKY